MAAGPQRNPAEQSVGGKVLKGHTCKTKKGSRPVWMSGVLRQRSRMWGLQLRHNW